MIKLLTLLSLLVLLNIACSVIHHEFNITSFGPSEGILIKGAHQSVFYAGDINGDLFSDLIVAAPSEGPNETVYIIFGKRSCDSAINLSALTGDQGIKITGADAGDYLGTVVSNAGDFNRDGVDDILAAPDSYKDTVYLIFGKREGLSDIDLAVPI